MNPFDPFKGDTLYLRAWESGDLDSLQVLLNHPDLLGCRYLPEGAPDDRPLSRHQVESTLEAWSKKQDGFHLAAIHADSGVLLGYVEAAWGWDPYCPDFTLVVDPGHRRQGLGAQLLRLVLGYLFDRTLAYNAACAVEDWNDAGLAFLDRHGFQNAGRMRRTGIRHGRFTDTVVLDVLKPEWERRSEGSLDAA